MDQVLGIGSPTATFHSPSRTMHDDPHIGGHFVNELRADGLRVEREVFMSSFDWNGLVAFFANLAESWRGFEGERSWHSLEHDLFILASSDSFGHCLLDFTVRDGPISTWQVKVGGFAIDAGEDMSATARSIKRWSARTSP